MKPQRIQLSRKKGFNLQAVSMALNGLPAVNCARPGRWGNPFRVGHYAKVPTSGWLYRLQKIKDNQDAVDTFKAALKAGVMPGWSLADIRVELRGRNLACWCRGDRPCHCDHILFIANA